MSEKEKLGKVDPKPPADLARRPSAARVLGEINLNCEYCNIWFWYCGDPQGESPLWPCDCESAVCLK